MPSSVEPRVTVLTPVYNGARFLRECMESVLAQDYENWEYIVVDNCSTDDTVKIAHEYCARDARIRVVTSAEFVSMPANFNRATRMVPASSRYFKLLCADDWILPRFLSKTVALAEAQPSTGLVCSHQQSGDNVRWAELPTSTTFLTGREASRLALLRGARILPAPTAALFRSEAVMTGKPFYPNNYPHSDTSACYEILQHADYGVVHETLAVERVHEEQISSKIADFNSGDAAYVEVFLTYGPRFLGPSEFAARREEVFDEYYRTLARALLKLRGRSYWRFQHSRMSDVGLSLDKTRIARAAFSIALEKAGLHRA